MAFDEDMIEDAATAPNGRTACDGAGSEIQSDFSDPDFSENGRDYWEHYHYVVEKGQVLLRIDKYLAERIKGTSRNRIQNAAEDRKSVV